MKKRGVVLGQGKYLLLPSALMHAEELTAGWHGGGAGRPLRLVAI
jgi:hypothetical protein